MPYCTSCSAPLLQNRQICRYCGVKNDINLKGIHQYTVVRPDSERICPICSIAMETIDIKATEDHFFIERCPKCMGLFFDPNELNALLDQTVDNVYEINRKKLFELNKEKNPVSERMAAYIKCPVCRQLMNRNSFGLRSGVVIDKCSHGVWLDNGDFRRILEWRKAGGQLYHEKVRYEERQRKRNNGTGISINYGSPDEVSSMYSFHQDKIDVTSLLGSVANTIWRLFS